MSGGVDQFLEQYYARHPVNATFTGMHAHDDRLPDWTPAGRKADADERVALRARLERETSLDATLAIANLDVRAAEHDSGFFIARNPALWTGEAIFGAVALMLREFAPRDVRLGPLASRLDAIVPFFDTMRSSVDARLPSRYVSRAQKECGAAIRLFGAGLEAWLNEEPLDAQLVARVRTAASRARDAFTRCNEWLASMQYASTPDTGCGDRLFATLLKRGHFCERTPSSLLRSAEEAFAIEKDRLAALGNHSGDDPVPEPYLEAFATRWNACRTFSIEHDIAEWPEWPLRYVSFPAWARESAPHLYWLFYRSPAPLDALREHDYLVRPGWTASAITLNHVVHHGALGHHVQNAHATRQAKSRIGTIAAVDCANRIGMFLGGSMAEGWACYATELMDEMGFLTPHERSVEQQSRVRMAARAIVDIRMHTLEMGIPEAISFYVNEVGMTEVAADGEATKNSMFPCTALMYWLGTQGILDLRKKLQGTGQPFTMRQFHDELLSYGSIPVLLVSRLMTGAAQ